MTKKKTETTQEENELNIRLGDIPFDETYKLRSGSAGQLVCGMLNMAGKTTPEKETDEYKKVLYPRLRELTTEIASKFEVMLNASSEKDRNVRLYNLCGYGGKIKIEKGRKYPFVSGVNPNVRYGYANFGYFLKTLNQRIEYLGNRNTPKRYQNDETLTESFLNLKNECQEFAKYLKEEVEPSWAKAVEEARTEGGDTVKANLSNRTTKEKKELRVKKERKTTPKYVRKIKSRKSESNEN